MARAIDLPEPWEHLETITENERDQLEQVAGSGLSYDDLEEHDVVRRYPEIMEPRSRKSWLVMGYRWHKVRNKETGAKVLLRLQTFDGINQSVSSVIFPTDVSEPALSGTDLRTFPVAAIAAAYSYDQQVGDANLKTFLHLMEETINEVSPLEKLPAASSDQKFLALVARQYRHIEENEPGEYVAGRMAKLNNKSLATVQRWVAQSRKAGFLPPTPTGRRPND